jgi:hypothetical protein
MIKDTKRTNTSKNTELRALSDSDLNAVSGGVRNQDTAAFRAFVLGAARGFGGEVCIGNVCSGGGGTVTF